MGIAKHIKFHKYTAKKVAGLTEKQRLDLTVRIEDLRMKYALKLKEVEASNPFYFYKPSDGNVDGERLDFLRRWLKEDDIPVGNKLDCQMDIHMSTANIIGASGGNQGGKSVGCCIEGYIWGTGALPNSLRDIYPKEKLPKEFPQFIRVVGVDHKTLLGNIIPTYQFWCPRDYLKDGSWEKSYSHEQRVLKLYKGDRVIGMLEFMTNQQDVESFSGPPRHGVIYDEEPRHDIYKENLLRFSTTDKVKILFGMTPTNGITWVKEKIYDKRFDKDESIEWFKMPSITNKKIKLDVLEKILQGLSSYEEIRMRLLGEFVSLSGLVYGNLFHSDVHVIEPFPITDDYYVVRGLDPHLVKPTVGVEMAIDREGNKYVIGCYSADKDTAEVKKDLKERAKNYRLGWTVCDKSANSTIRVFGDRNIYLELSRGENAIPALFTSDKWTGSIHAGVDEIKQSLKLKEKGKPSLYFFNTKENRLIINAMRSLERDSYNDEDKSGIKDKIKEGKHDAHAALRYIFQRPVRWMPKMEVVPEYEPVSEAVGW